MKISSKIRIIYILFAVEHVCILVVFLFSMSEINIATAKNSLVYDVVKDVSDITILVNELNDINKDRILYQWNVKTQKIKYNANEIANFFGQKDFVVLSIFNDIDKTTDLIHAVSLRNTGDKKFLKDKRYLFNNLVLILQTVSSSSNILLKKSQKKIQRIQNQCKYGMIVIFVVFICSILWAFWFLQRGIVNPLRMLVEKTKDIGRGNLESTIDLDSRDEIGDFARSFDEMTRKLRTITVLRDELIEEIHTRKIVEKELQRKEKTLKALSSNTMSIMEEERKRIGCEIHDSVVQDLIAMKLHQENAILFLNKKNPEVDLHQFVENVSYIQKTIVLLREIIMGLRPSILDDLGLAPALQWYCREFAKAYEHYEFGIDIKEIQVPIPENVTTAIFRVTQEALKNIVKHSVSDSLEVILFYRNNILELCVQDYGKGFDMESQSYKLMGMGISGMRERVESAGGVFAVQSTAGKGVAIRAVFKL